MVRQLVNFARRPLADKLLFAKAYIFLGICRLAINTLPFRRIAKFLGQHMLETPEEVSDECLDESRRITWAVKKASRFTLWKSNCLPQAMTAQHLLRRKGIGSTLYLGALLDEAKAMKAHAWLRCGPRIVTGREGHRQFGVVAKFADLGAGRATA
jgi:hypothetical protein